MKKVKIILVLMFMLIVTGCSNRDLLKAYNKMKISKDMNGYSIDLRIYGNFENKSYKEIVRIENYKDEKFLIREININIDRKIKSIENTENIENIIYVIDDKIYKETDNEYKEVSSYKYTNPLIYLEGLKNVKKTISEKEETIGTNEYQVYEVEIKSKYINKLLKEIGINTTVKENKNATISVNKEGYLHRIIYEIDDLAININYFGINSSSDIELPN